MKTPNQTMGYFAIRKGKLGLNGAIFLSWDDCRCFVGADTSLFEYNVFDTITDAEDYIRSFNRNVPIQNSSQNEASTYNEDKRPSLTTATNHDGESKKDNDVSDSMAKTEQQQQQQELEDEAGKLFGERRRKPDLQKVIEWCKKQNQQTQQQQQPQQQSQSSQLPIREPKNLDKPTRSNQKKQPPTQKQPSQPPIRQQAKRKRSNQEKQPTQKAQRPTRTPKKNQLPKAPTIIVASPSLGRLWAKQYELIQKFHQQHGHFCVPSDGEWEELCKWVTYQRLDFQSRKQKTSYELSDERLYFLQQIGFDFHDYSWDERYEQLKRFKETHGPDAKITLENDKIGLGEWVKKQFWDCRAYRQGHGNLNSSQIDKLKQLGIQSEKDRKYDEEFERMIPQLAQFKEQHGHCKVTDATPELFAWVKKQKKIYHLYLQKGKQSLLSHEKAKRLMHMGLVLAIIPKGKNPKWEERMEELRKYKAEHGTLKMPAGTSLLFWLHNQRHEIRKFKRGQHTSMTLEKMHQLEQVGVHVKLVEPRAAAETKTWEERLADLVEYKKLHGHTLVKNDCPLGRWVSKQRVFFNRMQKGQQASTMTPERVFKLAQIGFCFDASNWRGARQKEQAEEEEDDDDDDWCY